MTEPTRLLVHGATGRMGQALMRLASARQDVHVVAAAARRAPIGLADDVVGLASDQLAEAPPFDVAIDFSLPEGFPSVLEFCTSRGVALVSGTTGLDASQAAALDAASRSIPVCWAANFSLGVAVLGDLVERAARVLSTWDCDIVESHHVHKKDAPSGTALAMGARAEAGGATPRYASLRAGDIVGEHLVQFATAGERIELVHRATNRDIFAQGALHVASRIRGRTPGRYAPIDLL